MDKQTGKTYQCQECGASFLKLSALMEHRRLVGHRDRFICNICHKHFGRKDNLDRHLERHQDGNNHQCDYCGTIFSRLDSLQRHVQQRHNQYGGALKRQAADAQQPGPAPKRRVTKYDNPQDFYSIRKIDDKHIPKFNTTATDYKVTFSDLEVRDLRNILTSLRRLFQSILDTITSFIEATDLVRLSVECPELDFPITLPFMKRSELTADRFLTEIERVLQSYEQFVLDSGLEIRLVHVHLPTGGGRKRCNYVDLDRMLKEKRCFIRIQNTDNLCCARALVTAQARIDGHEQWNNIRQGRQMQSQLAQQLHSRAHVPLENCGVEEVKKFQAVMEGYQIHVVSKEHFNAIIYAGPEAEKKIYLYLHDNHYDVITSMPGFLNKNYYCCSCQKGYDHKEAHKCNNICTSCHKIHELNGQQKWMYCTDCHRHFRGVECYYLHKKSTSQGKSTCKCYYRCKECGQTININMHKKKHACGEVYCKTCKDYYEDDHQCYMQPVEMLDTCDDDENSSEEDKNINEIETDDEMRQVYIFFDLECTQNNVIECEAGYQPGTDGRCMHCRKSLCGSFEHQPNLCVAHKVCTHCISREVNSGSECDHCGKNELVFSGADTTQEFCSWLFTEENKGSTVLCHNFKGYDSFPILRYLYQNGILPKVIPNGAKNMSVEVPACKIRMIDSLNFLPMALSKIPEMFGISELSKGYFPHFYNCKEHWHKTLDHLPDEKYYNPDAMKAEDRTRFQKWYSLHQYDKFCVQEELLKYCKSDVDILRRCCLKFRELFMDMTASDEGDCGIDPFEQCITIASACNLVFRSRFLQPDTIGIIPSQGYCPEEKQSVKALQWIKYLAGSEGRRIQHARNGGEKSIGPYRVDGYYENGKDKVVLEFHGCFWHGCTKCYSRHTLNPVSNMSMGDLYEKTLDKQRLLENEGYIYISKWECDFDNDVKTNKKIKDFVNQLNMVTPLEPRDAFYGGRTEAFKLYQQASDEQQIKYYDVTSLYPFINKTGKAVLGHPTITTEGFVDLSNYEGLIKCKILPPREIDIPVLPAKINGKLLFPLCRTCAEANEQEKCPHNANDRALTGTWVTDEVKKAVQERYQITDMYEVWHFDRVEQYDPVAKSGGIFTDYVNTFLKMKQEASGWPVWCKTEEDKHQYIQQYLEKEGISLDYHKISKNKGLRSLAKLMLNR